MFRLKQRSYLNRFIFLTLQLVEIHEIYILVPALWNKIVSKLRAIFCCTTKRLSSTFSLLCTHQVSCVHTPNDCVHSSVCYIEVCSDTCTFHSAGFATERLHPTRHSRGGTKAELQRQRLKQQQNSTQIIVRPTSKNSLEFTSTQLNSVTATKRSGNESNWGGSEVV